MTHGFSILGVEFRLRGAASVLPYIQSFMAAYGDDDDDERARRTISVQVVTDATSPGEHAAAEVVPVHRSKHTYWTFDGLLLSRSPRLVVWPTRGISVRLSDTAAAVEILVHGAPDSRLAGEATFHALRGLALYLRPAERWLLHASAISHAGRCVLFAGDTFSGKTTLFTEAVIRAGARPLSNDRVAVDSQLRARSWPSYASYCEGTLLRHPELRDAALAYEADSCQFRTQRWPRPLANDFSSTRKRIYPMQWFSDAVGRRYLRHGALGALVLSRVAPDVGSVEFRRLNLGSSLDRERLLDRLEAISFDRREPSFLPWHGLSPPAPTRSEQLVAALDRSGVPVFELALRPDDLDALGTILEEARRCAPTSS